MKQKKKSFAIAQLFDDQSKETITINYEGKLFPRERLNWPFEFINN